MARILFITGTDTGVGKTELAVLLARFLRAQGVQFRAVKPFCAGGREDALRLDRAQGGKGSVHAINPWHFKAPLAPLVAARLEGSRCSAREALAFLRKQAASSDLLVVEGAGGVLTPLAEDLDARRLIVELRAIPVIVCPDRLGAINQALMALETLPGAPRRRALVVLVEAARPDGSVATNGRLLEERLGPGRVLRFPRLTAAERRAADSAGTPRKCLPLLRALAG